MNLNQKLILSAVFLGIITIFSIVSLTEKKNSIDTDIILYYGNSCPHCKIVEDYIAKKNPAQRTTITQKEVWANESNKNDFIQKATACGLDLNNLGVPMLWNGANSKCYVGDSDIINFLNNGK